SGPHPSRITEVVEDEGLREGDRRRRQDEDQARHDQAETAGRATVARRGLAHRAEAALPVVLPGVEEAGRGGRSITDAAGRRVTFAGLGMGAAGFEPATSRV